ncbi:hypothetical protein A3D84_04705 [Candidatus Woesebacteria bacterium RIFCSPHIGHO2_02_FULL_42_20]|uniref:Uncharacterized protein n=1 Tax=Candidatus Woesebacteria bacterium RIFCSPHIGHO2_12_FULL_41_24 TaxID=1802510 RepID=A0A1F8AUX6_9BACT|nr:MAG: hypothetical protein A2W15_00180 [Candidatus Woesebacteria bacterium RBG_16_41_13]OGM30990.1 MAG: hypothetical protein A2873_01815 [Candidatus Woesebacteria bacterium RIFCSPHIGHO2_01_FULL_42_80]OGM34480.1 MAG: hypothetical protein A3D84_04705 [Candidatus Woesebacteria bacterium RIFCSPHIGHO2_02_FULL_42_20]OGM55564.1 MAG: hypothetical protein A3E44_04845 [Candidatus Woesebacteria bacterium RIFCSPHIGHO2_12_FULL_41_24]OGM67360.1 MAG: hypothetical protein A2969_02870 [Candidatus Woesebacteri
MITDNDVAKIRKALKPDFDRMVTKSDLDQLRQDTKSDLDQLRQDTKSDLDQTEKNIKKYVHEGVDAVVDGIDNILRDYQFDSRIQKLEKIHPGGRHHQID